MEDPKFFLNRELDVNFEPVKVLLNSLKEMSKISNSAELIVIGGNKLRIRTPPDGGVYEILDVESKLVFDPSDSDGYCLLFSIVAWLQLLKDVDRKSSLSIRKFQGSTDYFFQCGKETFQLGKAHFVEPKFVEAQFVENLAAVTMTTEQLRKLFQTAEDYAIQGVEAGVSHEVRISQLSGNVLSISDNFDTVKLSVFQENGEKWYKFHFSLCGDNNHSFTHVERMKVAGQGSREKSRTVPKPKLPESGVDLIKEDPSKEAKNKFFDVLVIEALSSTNQPNRLDITALMSYIEQRVEEVPQNFRKLLDSRLRRLVKRDKLEKIDNCYRIKDASLPEPKPSNVQEAQPIQRPQPTQPIPSPCVSRETFRKAATLAALGLAKGEDLNNQVAEAVQEVDVIAKLIEEQEDILKFAKELCEMCSEGKNVQIKVEEAPEETPFQASARRAAQSLANAEDLSYQVAESVKESELIQSLIEEQERMVKLAVELVEKCADGKTVPQE